MKNLSENQSNKRFLKVQEEIKRLLSIVMYNVEEQTEGFDSIIATSNNPEDIKIVEELSKSNKKLDSYAQEYVQSIGIPSKKEPQKTSSKKEENKKNISTANTINRINPIINNIDSKDSNTTIIKSRDEDQR